MVVIHFGHWFSFRLWWDFRVFFPIFAQCARNVRVGMTFYKKQLGNRKKDPEVPPNIIPRSTAPAFDNVELAIEADRARFAEHPEADEYIREFCPGEFGAVKLPNAPPGFRHVTLVTVIHRTKGVADGRYRRMISVCDDA
jgi:hypothetical protein